VALESGVGNPRDLLVILEPAGKSKRIAHMALHTEGEGLETLDQLECTEGVEASSKVAEDLDTDADGEGDGAKGIEKLQTVVALSRLVELRETCGVLAPIELSGVDDDTGDGGTVAADPLCGRVDNDVGTWVVSLGLSCSKSEGGMVAYRAQ